MNDMYQNRQSRTKQKAQCLTTLQGPPPAKYLATANELGQKKKAEVLKRQSASGEK